MDRGSRHARRDRDEPHAQENFVCHLIEGRIRQSRPVYGIGLSRFQVETCKTIEVVPRRSACTSGPPLTTCTGIPCSSPDLRTYKTVTARFRPFCQLSGERLYNYFSFFAVVCLHDEPHAQEHLVCHLTALRQVFKWIVWVDRVSQNLLHNSINEPCPKDRV